MDRSYEVTNAKNDMLASSEKLIAEKLFFCFDNVMFGELFGKSTSLVQVSNNRMYFNFHCLIQRGQEDKTEKYKFSLCSRDIEEMHIHFGRTPSFVAIETSSGFAAHVCKKIGENVLCPSSNDPKKRYILLMGNLGLENNVTNDIDQCNLVMCVSSWARVNLLDYNTAVNMLKEIVDSFPRKKRHNQKMLYKKITALKPLSSLPVTNFNNNTPAAFTFSCNKVKFGKLYGKSIAPVRVVDKRMYFSISCKVKHRRTRSIEKYTFSVGASDVSEISVYIGHMPSFLIIKTTITFASVVCKRIGENVLCPGSANRKKQYIFLLLNQSYNETYERAKRIEDSFTEHVRPWTRLNILSSDEALDLLRDLL